MKISSSFNYNRKNATEKSFKGIPPTYTKIPEVIGNIGKLAGDYVSMPEQKLFLATTALMLQPLIDLKFAEEDKKVDAAIKSASKAIAGGLTGVTIRAGFISLTKNLIGFDKKNKFNDHFLPKDAVEMLRTNPDMAKIRLSKYSQSLGTLMAIAFMIGITNRNVDVPLTSDLQDLISGVVKENKTWLQSFTDVKNNRAAKIKTWTDKWVNRFKKVGKKTAEIGKIIVEPEKKTTEASK